MTEGFAAIPNWIVRDEAVSIYAIAVYVALATHTGPGGIHPSQATLAKEARCSERQVRTALNELGALGVVERVRRKSEVGRATNGYVLHPHGRLKPDEESMEVTAPHAATGEVPAHSDRGSGTRAHLTPLIEEEPLKKNPESAFDEFWSTYPRKVGRAAARAKFLSLAKVTDVEILLEGVRRFAADPNLPEKRFIPHPTTWLGQGRWEDEPLPERGGDAPGSGVQDVPLVPPDLPGWLGVLRIPVEEYVDRRDEPGWVEEMERLARRAS